MTSTRKTPHSEHSARDRCLEHEAGGIPERVRRKHDIGNPSRQTLGAGPSRRREVGACPVEKHANAILRSGKQMVSALHRLRKNLSQCRHCPAFGACEFRENFNQQIDAVILEVNEEWGLL